jgi:hypothetical protein
VVLRRLTGGFFARSSSFALPHYQHDVVVEQLELSVSAQYFLHIILINLFQVVNKKILEVFKAEGACFAYDPPLQTHCTIPSVNKPDKVFHLFAQSLIISKKRLPRFLPYYKHVFL